MNIIPIVLLSILIILLIGWCIQEANSKELNFHLDCFWVLNNYMKRSFYKVLQKYSDNETSKSLRSKLENVDHSIIPISQQFTKGIIDFPRKNELIRELRFHLSNQSKSIEKCRIPDCF